MRKSLLSAVAALALIAGATTEAKADCNAGALCVSAPASLAPAVFAAGLVGLGVYMIANANAPAGSLRAAAPSENMLQFAANARQRESVPAFAFVPASEVAQAR